MTGVLLKRTLRKGKETPTEEKQCEDIAREWPSINQGKEPILLTLGLGLSVSRIARQ